MATDSDSILEVLDLLPRSHKSHEILYFNSRDVQTWMHSLLL
jgi:hypothetical protein